MLPGTRELAIELPTVRTASLGWQRICVTKESKITDRDENKLSQTTSIDPCPAGEPKQSRSFRRRTAYFTVSTAYSAIVVGLEVIESDSCISMRFAEPP